MKTLQQLLTTGLVLVSVTFANAQWSAVRFDSANTFHKVFAATATTVFAIGTEPVNYEYFMLRTNNAGASWDSITINTLNDTFQLTELLFVDQDNGFVGGTKNNRQVLLKTNDNGNSFSPITPDQSSFNPITSIDFINGQTGFVTEGTTIYKTENGGTSWTSLVPSFSINYINFVDENTGYACGMDAMSTNGVVMKTIDGGQSWSPSLTVADPLLFGNELSKLDFINSDIGYALLGNTNRLFKTENGGITWDTIDVDASTYLIDIDFISADHGHLLSYYGQIFATEDGGNTLKVEYETDWFAYGPSVYLNSLSFVGGTGYVGGSNGLIKKHARDESTGISENERNESIIIYPNPFSSSATIMVEDNENSVYSFSLYNALGGEVRRSEIRNGKSEISGDDLPAALYFYKVSNEKNEIVGAGKIIVQ